MINLAPINKNVRQTLVDREKASARRDDNDSHEAISDNLQHKLIKSLWVKMYSAVTWNGVQGARIYGGEVFRNEGSGYEIPFGYAELYGQGTLEPTTDRLMRPVAGIMDFSCEYKGGLSAIREATINWVAHSLDDLERLIPNFEWTLRDDGSFNVQTTMVSRGVNVLSKQLDQQDAPLTTSQDGNPDVQEVWPTLSEFIAGMNETLITVAVGSTGWWGSKNKNIPLAKKTDRTWQRESVQPPGVFMTRSD